MAKSKGNREQTAGPLDPVLGRLEGLLAEGWTQAAIAEEIGVTPAAFGAWLAHRQATLQKSKPSSAARLFDLRKLSVASKKAVARLLGTTVDELVEESQRAWGHWTGVTSVEPGSSHWDSAILRLADDVVGALLARAYAAATVVDETRTATDRHRLAAAAESVEGVVGTCIVPEHRGSLRCGPYQDQVAVFAAPPDHQRGDGEQQQVAWTEVIKEKISEQIAHDGIDAWWEHSRRLVPVVTLTLHGQPVTLLGSLVSPRLEAAQPPRGESLLPPPADITRTGAVVSNPYGGARPIGAFMAAATGAGLLKGENVAREIIERRGRGRLLRGAFVDVDDTADRRRMGYAQHELLRLLSQPSYAPGAWVLETEARYLKGYPPLAHALADLPQVLIVVHLGEEWRRMAAWRLATAQRDEDGNDVLESPQPGAKISDAEKVTLKHHADTASDKCKELEQGEENLFEVVRRREDPDRLRRSEDPHPLTISLTLGQLPPSFPWYVPDPHSYWLQGHGSGAPAVAVYPDDVDSMVDAWQEAAAQALCDLSREAAFTPEERQDFAASLRDDYLREAVQQRVGHQS